MSNVHERAKPNAHPVHKHRINIPHPRRHFATSPHLSAPVSNVSITRAAKDPLHLDEIIGKEEAAAKRRDIRRHYAALYKQLKPSHEQISNSPMGAQSIGNRDVEVEVEVEPILPESTECIPEVHVNLLHHTIMLPDHASTEDKCSNATSPVNTASGISDTSTNGAIDVTIQDTTIQSIRDVDALMDRYTSLLQERFKKSATSAIFEAQLANFKSQHGPYTHPDGCDQEEDHNAENTNHSDLKHVKFDEELTTHFSSPLTHKGHKHHDHAHEEAKTWSNPRSLHHPERKHFERPQPKSPVPITNPSLLPVHSVVVVTQADRLDMKKRLPMEEMSPRAQKAHISFSDRPCRVASARQSWVSRLEHPEPHRKLHFAQSPRSEGLPTSLLKPLQPMLFQGCLNTENFYGSQESINIASNPTVDSIAVEASHASSCQRVVQAIGPSPHQSEFAISGSHVNPEATIPHSMTLGDGGWTTSVERVRGVQEGMPSVYMSAPKSPVTSRPSTAILPSSSSKRVDTAAKTEAIVSGAEKARPSSAVSVSRKVSVDRHTTGQCSINGELRKVPEKSPDNNNDNNNSSNKSSFANIREYGREHSQLVTTVEEPYFEPQSYVHLSETAINLDVSATNHVSQQGPELSEHTPSSALRMMDVRINVYGSRLSQVGSPNMPDHQRKRDWYRVVHGNNQSDREPVEIEKYPNLYDPPHGLRPLLCAMSASDVPPPDQRLLVIDSQFDEHGRSRLLNEFIHEEIKRLGAVLELTGGLGPSEVSCRRGVLLASIGQYEEALKNLNHALDSDPHSIEALWYRHMIRLKEGNLNEALDNLNVILGLDPDHLGAWRAKARLTQELERPKHAIVAYTNIIRLRPQESDPYFQRALLFKAEHETVYASQDFAVVRRLDPDNETAMRHLAIHSFERHLYEDAVKAFEKLLQVNPGESSLYAYHGRCLANLAKWDDALKDFNEAIRLAPESAENYFHRGCVLRERNSQRSIEDFSISVLIDDSKKNADAFFQRAMLYVKLEEYDLAVADYKRVVEIDPVKASAHLNLGILYHKIFKKLNDALQCFNLAIKADPTCKRALLARAELYQQLHSNAHLGPKHDITHISLPKRKGSFMSYVDSAVADYSRAIHMRPRDHLLYLHRGRLLLRESRIQDATKDFETAFKINSSIALNFVQRSLVLSFQGKYHDILEEYDIRLETEKLSTNPAALLIVAKAKFKLGDCSGALKYLDLANEHSPHDPKVHFQLGLVLKAMSEWSQAAREFSKCVGINAGDAKALYNLGLCLLHQGDVKGLTYLRDALAKDPKNFEVYITRAAFQFKRGDLQKAIENCNAALSLEPGSLRGHLLRGACYLALQQSSVAVRDFTKAANLDKTCHLAFYNRAVAYQALHDFDSALRDYSIVLLQQEKQYDALRNRGLLYWQRNDAQNAFLDFSMAAIGFPRDARLRGVLGLCCHKLVLDDEATAHFDQAITIDPDMLEMRVGKGNVLAAMGKTKEARRLYAYVLHIKPRTAPAAFNIALTFQQDNNIKKALHFFTSALALDPDAAYALDGRACALLQSGNHLGALVDASEAIKLTPWKAEYISNRGVVHEAMANPAEALNDFKMAVEKSKRFALAYFNLGNAYLKQGAYEKAVLLYAKCFHMEDNQDGLAMLNCGVGNCLLGETQAALDNLDVAAKLCPDDAHVFFNRGHVLEVEGRLSVAEADYAKSLHIAPDAETYNARGDVEGKKAKPMSAMEDFQHALLPEDGFVP
ncbi:hypothetical protein SeLEV6574_g00087 [Synchytrium endobioticum]|uniref:Uncharacterized protein n=1 Tax=Synchytrium endobioticum TaxID=286115 RepID=A0A507DLK9_9FUNG|nr:hypothetical protein SeLEV6574_g00087 [Synchytrium endobioticum]